MIAKTRSGFNTDGLNYNLKYSFYWYYLIIDGPFWLHAQVLPPGHLNFLFFNRLVSLQ